MKHLIEILLVSLVVGGVSGSTDSREVRRDVVRRLPAVAAAELPRPVLEDIVRLLPRAEDRYAWPALRDPESLGVAVTAASAIVVDRDNGKVLFEKNADEARPIASITKLMTALVFLDTDPDFAAVIEIESSDHEPADSTFFEIGERLTVRDAWHAALIGSANDAARALVRASGLAHDEFVRRMNARARALGMTSTRFVEPTGIDVANVSTARELTHLIRAAREAQLIREATERSTYEVRVGRGTRRVRSTNLLLTSFLAAPPYDFVVGKTGSLDEAGFCLAISVDQGTHGVIVVGLGSIDHFSRFADVKALAYWAFTKWEWPDSLAVRE